eukprot:7943252-Pyramimonas_sp.AAC.1
MVQKHAVRNRLTSYLCVWGRRRRRISLSAISDPTGLQVSEPSVAAKLLAAHWGQVRAFVE